MCALTLPSILLGSVHPFILVQKPYMWLVLAFTVMQHPENMAAL